MELRMKNITFKKDITVSDYTKLRAAVGWPVILPEQAKLSIDGSRFLLAAYNNDAAVGIGRVVSDGGYVCYLSDMIVLPEYQHQGIGSEILKRLTAMIKEDMKPGFQTNFVLLSATGKEPFYERFGFSKRPNNYTGFGMAQWITKE
jgi:GNAT superfamily N-acetyltransferase